MAYALMSEARFIVQSSVKKAQFQTVMQTKVNDTLENKLTAVFGAELTRQMSALSAVQLSSSSAIKFFGLGDKEDGEELAESALSNARAFTFTGFISKNGTQGRAATDRQFFYINKRPVDLPFLARIMNAEWRKITSKRHPACCINLEVEQSTVDINLAPDKRTVLLKHRKYAEFAFKSLLERHWNVDSGID